MPRRPSRRTTALLTGLLALTAACGLNGGDCNTRGGTSTVRVQVPAPLRDLVHTFRVELCQGEHCGSVNFPAAADADGAVARGVSLTDDAYLVDLARMGKGWSATAESGLTVTGFGKRGRVLLSSTDQFTFDASYPNGKDCAPTVLQHGIGIGGDDLVG